MDTTFLFHGMDATPRHHWMGWLEDQLRDRGVQVIAPQFPGGEEQTLIAWLSVLEPMRAQLSGSTVIGHSLGGNMILHLLEQWADVRLAHAVSVAAPIRPLGHVKYDEVLSDFLSHDFDWEAIRSRAGRWTVIQSDNDPYVPLIHGEELAEHVGTDITLIPQAGHFFDSSGYAEFPQLLDTVL